VLAFSPGPVGFAPLRELTPEDLRTAFEGKLFAYLDAIAQALRQQRGAVGRRRLHDRLRGNRIGAAFGGRPVTEIVSVTKTAARIWVEARVTGRSRAGEPYENDLAYVFEVADGKITALREYLDTIAAQEIFG